MDHQSQGKFNCECTRTFSTVQRERERERERETSDWMLFWRIKKMTRTKLRPFFWLESRAIDSTTGLSSKICVSMWIMWFKVCTYCSIEPYSLCISVFTLNGSLFHWFTCSGPWKRLKGSWLLRAATSRCPELLSSIPWLISFCMRSQHSTLPLSFLPSEMQPNLNDHSPSVICSH